MSRDRKEESTVTAGPGAGNFHCTACERDVERFDEYGLPPRPGRCPLCGAKPRHRAMLRYIREVVSPQAPRAARYLEVGAAKFATREYVRPAVIGLQAWHELGLVKSFRQIGYHTSADRGGDRSRVVGYAGYQFGLHSALESDFTCP